jgi:meckelin
VDVILVDWEKPKREGLSVSMWRKVMIANEFDRLQSMRKTSLELSLFLVCICSIESHQNGTNNIIEEFALNSCFWIVTIAVQKFWQFAFFERYITETKSQRFIDLCTLANISVVLLDDMHHGYYLHCRSPYEFADCDIKKLCDNMRSEGQGIVPSRGLDAIGAPEDCQSFEMFISDTFQKQCRDVSACHLLSFPKRLIIICLQARLTYKNLLSKLYEGIRDPEHLASSIEEMQLFLISFIEQSPSPPQGLKRVVRTSGIVERTLGLVPVEVRGTNEINILSPDETTWAKDYLFLDVTFLGIELDLCIHDFLTYTVIQMSYHKIYVSAIVTYASHLVRTALRRFFGSRNLAKKSFMDSRFLSK